MTELPRCSQRQQARDGLLDHRLFAVEREQLLGTTLSTERPKPGAAASSENHGIEIGIEWLYSAATELSDFTI